MKQFLMLFIILAFSSFTKEEIIYTKDYGQCKNLDELFSAKIKNGEKYYDDYGGFNAQNCNLKTAVNKCCYVSLKYNKKWHHVCANVKLDEKNFFDAYCNEIKKIQDTTNGVPYFKDLDCKKDLKVDCFSKNLTIIRILLLMIIISLF